MGGKRPDRAVTVYAQLARRAFPDVPIYLGGLEASLRRFAHYDYWADHIMPSVLRDSGADGLMYGMGEHSVVQLAKNLKAGKHGIDVVRDIRGVAYLSDTPEGCAFPSVRCPSLEEVLADKVKYAESVKIQYDEQDAVTGRAIIQPHGRQFLIQNPPSIPLTTQEMDHVYGLPYMRTYHPSYEAQGGVPAIQEVQFSIIHNRGCIGACNFCALAFHQGRFISARSHESVIEEAKHISQHPDFKGYIHDVGGPTANFRFPACKKQEKYGLCRDKRCLFPQPCRNLEADHTDYLTLLRKLRALPGVKKVFVRSGLRYDYMMADKNDTFFTELVQYHISGQLKVAPEHMSDNALYYMGKPSFSVYEKFRQRVRAHQPEAREETVPRSVSHELPSGRDAGRRDSSGGVSALRRLYAAAGAGFLSDTGHAVAPRCTTPEIDPRTMKPVYVAKSREEKAHAARTVPVAQAGKPSDHRQRPCVRQDARI